MSEFVKGKFRKSIFENNGFVIGLFRVEEASDAFKDSIGKVITFKGYTPVLNEIDTYILYGDPVETPKYGKELFLSKVERLKPEDKDSMISFLSSDLFKGIGESKAKKIVSVLGRNALDTILHEPNNLILIEGITEKDIKTLHDTLLNYEESYEAIIKLEDMGFNTREATFIYSKYKKETISKIDENIYSVLDSNKFNFKRVDYLALNKGIEKDDINRVSSSIIYIMKTLSDSFGHTYFRKEDILMYMPKVLSINVDENLFDRAIDKLNKDNKIVMYNDRIYEKTMFDSETYIVKRLNILQHEKDNTFKKIDSDLKYVEDYLNVDYDETQENAIKNSIIKGLLVITGGPGTGKTTIEKGILELYKHVNKLDYERLKDRVVLLAPTGRASKRMSEACAFPASTIHRFLKWNKDDDTFKVNEYNKSHASLVILDEASMVDVSLFASLLRGLSVNCHIILVGDENQLPSVGAGNLLGDIIGSHKINVCHLTRLYRQSEGSNIIELASNIREGILDKSIFNKDDSLRLIECSESDMLPNILKESQKYENVSYKDFEVLAPMYKGLNGIDRINNSMESMFNKEKSNTITIGEEVYKEGDKVIQLNNMPDENVFNGDIGIISRIKVRPKKEVYITFDDMEVKYTPNMFASFKKAYAISIHKSQGSEFNYVIMPLTMSYKRMLYRKLIYTGITRCKKNLIMIGNLDALKCAIDNNIVDYRRTSIKEFLEDSIKNNYS